MIYISTFSKSIFPSCRVAYMVLPYSIMKKYHSQNHIGESDAVACSYAKPYIQRLYLPVVLKGI